VLVLLIYLLSIFLFISFLKYLEIFGSLILFKGVGHNKLTGKNDCMGGALSMILNKGLFCWSFTGDTGQQIL
jgi:hypothetical protein